MQVDNPFRPKRIGLSIGLPMAGRLHVPEWSLAFAALNYPSNTNVEWVTIKGHEVGEARQAIAEKVVESEIPWLFFLDDDTQPPYFCIRRLIYDIQNAAPDVMVAAGIYCSKTNPPEPLVFKEDGMGAFWDWKVGDVFECASIGTGCMMIRTEVFKHLEKPWFKTVSETPMEGDTGKFEITDDLWFCRKVRETGYKILADTGVQCIHWDVDTQTPYLLPEGSVPTISAIPKLTVQEV